MEREQFEKLVDRVVGEAQGVITAKEFCGNVSQAEFELAKAEADLAAAVATEGLFKGEDGWTPVSVRLPEEGSSIEVIALANGVVYSPVTAYLSGDNSGLHCAWYHMGNPLHNVTHWRRLPEPPQDGKTG